MTHPANTVLAQEDIRRIALKAGCDPERDDGALVAQLIALTERAVIEKLGASDAVPVAVVAGDFALFWHGHGPIAPIAEREGLSVGSLLYSERALAQARQQGHEAAQAELREDAERWRYIRRKLCLTGNGDGTCAMQAINLPGVILGWPEPAADVAGFCDAVIDAAMGKQS